MSDPSDDQEQSPSPDQEGDAPRFKVTDRRHFDRQGNLREDVDPEDESKPAPPEEELLVDAPETASAGAAGTSGAAGSAAASGRSATAPAEPGPTPSAASAPASGAAGPAEEESTGAPGEPAGPAPGTRPGGGGSPSADELPRDFSSLVQSMYFEALLYLGAVRHPQTGEVIEDPELAKYKIDLLGMLQDKTEGNLTPQESSELEEVLYQLRMLYMQKTKVANL